MRAAPLAPSLSFLLLASACAKPSPAPSEPAAPSAEMAASETSAGGHAHDHAAPEGVPTDRQFAVAPGDFAEANFQLDAGSTVRLRFNGTAASSWDVHSHGHDGETTIHQKGSDASGEISFTAPEAGLFSALWLNESSDPIPLQVTVSFEGDGAMHSWVPEDETP